MLQEQRWSIVWGVEDLALHIWQLNPAELPKDEKSRDALHTVRQVAQGSSA